MPIHKLPAGPTTPGQPAPKDRYPVRSTAYAASETELYDRIVAALGANRAVVAQYLGVDHQKAGAGGAQPGRAGPARAGRRARLRGDGGAARARTGAGW